MKVGTKVRIVDPEIRLWKVLVGAKGTIIKSMASSYSKAHIRVRIDSGVEKGGKYYLLKKELKSLKPFKPKVVISWKRYEKGN